MSETKFGSWSVDQCPVTIEYSLVAIEEIRQEVAQGFQKLSRGGIEVGGVLYGTRDGRTIRILAMRPMTCEHARGPGLLLSDNDREMLAQQLVRDREDPHLEGFICVGWFLSHTRSEILLAESDLQVYSEYFPAPWQVTMVIRPGRGGSMRAGFFVRENDGNVNAERSYLEFNFPDRLAGVLDRARHDRPERGERRAYPRPESPPSTATPSLTFTGTREMDPPPSAEVPAAAQVPSAYDNPQYLPGEARRSGSKKWIWAVMGAVVALGLAGAAALYWIPGAGPQPVSLTVLEHEGQLQIEWNHTAQPILAAAKGSLEIVDGNQTKSIALTQGQLATGKFTYQRNTGDIEVRLSVQETDGTRVQEASRFLGQPPAKPKTDELDALDARRTELEAEVARLRSQNQTQTERIQQLERTLRILQTRLGAK